MRQQHLNNGSVVLFFEAFLNAPRAGETGTLTVSTTDGSGPWSASKNITISTAGESNATVQVRIPFGPLPLALAPGLLLAAGVPVLQSCRRDCV